MPSPVKHFGRRKLYRRKGGAEIKIKGKPYSRHLPNLDRKRKATKSWKRARYPQAFD